MKQSKPGTRVAIDSSLIEKKDKNKASGDALHMIVSGKEQMCSFTTRLPANLKAIATQKASDLGMSLNNYIKLLILKDSGLM